MKPNKKLLLFSLAVGILVALIALTIQLSTLLSNDISFVVPDFVSFLCCTGIALAAVPLFSGIVALLLMFFDWATIRTFLRLVAHRFSARIAAKNAENIYPCLQLFLYHVLSQNREFLHLPLGKDASCLVPAGYAPAYRSGCVFYRFQLIAPEKPEMDISLLRQIIQSYIVAEIQNHGIAGLPAVFQRKSVGTMPSVFVDKFYYDEGMHFIGFELLYVDNENAAIYVRNAIMRDAAPKQPTIEVTDADL